MRLGLLLPGLSDNPLGRRWLRFVLDRLESEKLTPFLVGLAEQPAASNYSALYANFFTGLIFSAFASKNSLKLWRLRPPRFSDYCWRLAGELLTGPNLRELSESPPENIESVSAEADGESVLPADSPWLWPVRSEQAETCLRALRLVVSPPLRLGRVREALALLESLGDNLSVRVPRWLFDRFELSADIFEPEVPTDYRKVDCELVWVWGYSPALHLRVLDWLGTAAFIAPAKAPWTQLLAEPNAALLYPPADPEFGVEVVDRLRKREAEREELIAANASTRARRIPASTRVKSRLHEMLGLP